MGDVWLDADARSLAARGGSCDQRPAERGASVLDHAAFIPKDPRKAEIAMEIVNTMLSEEYGAALTKSSNYGPMSSKAMAGFSAGSEGVWPRCHRRQNRSLLRFMAGGHEFMDRSVGQLQVGLMQGLSDASTDRSGSGMGAFRSTVTVANSVAVEIRGVSKGL